MACALFVLSAQAPSARAYDMDCKLILCIAGGFPTSCSDAYAYMLNRLKRHKPPVGLCSYAGVDGETLRYSEASVSLGADRWTECPGDDWRPACDDGGVCTNICAAGLRTYEQSFIEITIPSDDAEASPFQNHVRFGAQREVLDSEAESDGHRD